MIPIYDLHCDLLKYLQEDEEHTVDDLQCRCAIPQLEAGGVKFQTLPVFHTTDADSVAAGEAQVAAFKALLATKKVALYGTPSSKIAVALAVENAATFCGEEESMREGLGRLASWQEEADAILYVGLTWNEENRFGGGSQTDVGLTDDGRRLLEWMALQGIAVDLSHACDRLADGILEYIDAESLQLPILASHSNARAVTDVPRNLPDYLVKEIIERQGVIGLNLVNFVVGESPERIVDHVAHLFELGARQFLGFGADFFYEESLPPKQDGTQTRFFDEWPDAGCYPSVLELLKKHLKLSRVELEALAYGNVSRFVSEVLEH